MREDFERREVRSVRNDHRALGVLRYANVPLRIAGEPFTRRRSIKVDATWDGAMPVSNNQESGEFRCTTEPGSGSPVPVMRNSARPDIVTVVLVRPVNALTESCR